MPEEFAEGANVMRRSRMKCQLFEDNAFHLYDSTNL